MTTVELTSHEDRLRLASAMHAELHTQPGRVIRGSAEIGRQSPESGLRDVENTLLLQFITRRNEHHSSRLGVSGFLALILVVASSLDLWAAPGRLSLN